MSLFCSRPAVSRSWCYTSVHLLTSVAIQSVDLSVQSLFIPDSSGAVIKASLEMHAQKTSPS